MPAVISSRSRLDKLRSRDEPAILPAPSWAIVSFLLEDAAWCDWIYREFDGERFPRILLGRPSRFGNPYPERISVSPDPSDPIQFENYAESLQAAQHLILVVSPESGNSQMLLEHMRIFKAAGGEDRIVALVVKGEPGSPSAERGTDADREWLPKALAWRFENNTFQPAEYGEPMVIDARLGIASLAEVRIRLTAALLEVEPAELAELGVVIRNTPPPPAPDPIPDASPGPPEVALPEPAALPSARRSRWPIWAVGIAALGGLAGLAFWPGVPAAQPAAPKPAAAMTEPVRPEPIVEAVPATPSSAEATTGKTAPTAPTPSAPVAPAPRPAPPVAAAPKPAVPMAPALTPELIAFERKRHDLATRRDRLIRMAENRAASGDTVDALESFDTALEVSKELVQHTNQAHNSVIELCVLYRRLAAIAASLNSPADSRRYYELARRSLFDLKTSGIMPKEASKVLAEIEAGLRALPRN